MAKITTTKAATPTDNTSPTPPAPAVNLGVEAMAKMQTLFPPERWERIQRQAKNTCGLDAEALQGLCLKLISTRKARHPDNDAAADAAAANGLLVAISSTLTDADVKRLADALNGISAAADAAPVTDAAALPASAETPVKN